MPKTKFTTMYKNGPNNANKKVYNNAQKKPQQCKKQSKQCQNKFKTMPKKSLQQCTKKGPNNANNKFTTMPVFCVSHKKFKTMQKKKNKTMPKQV